MLRRAAREGPGFRRALSEPRSGELRSRRAFAGSAGDPGAIATGRGTGRNFGAVEQRVR